MPSKEPKKQKPWKPYTDKDFQKCQCGTWNYIKKKRCWYCNALLYRARTSSVKTEVKI